jgi:iron complex transport system substrate-binding protein
MKAVITFFLLLWATLVQAQAPQRIITIGGAITEMVYALNEQSRLIGNDTTSYYPKPAESLPKVGYQRALSAEGILSLYPDMVILTDEAGPPTVIAQIRAAGVTIVEIKAGRSVDDIKNAVKVIGKALACENKANTLIAKLDKQNEELIAITQNNINHKKVMFILQNGGGAPMVAGAETAADSIVKLSGASNVVTDYRGYKPLTPEAAVSLNPEVIVITQQGLEQSGGKHALLKSPGLSLTYAAKQGNVIAFDSLLMLGFGPRTIEAAIQLNKAYNHL